MDQHPDSFSARAVSAPTEAARRTAVYYFHPLAAGPLAAWDAELDYAAALGFTHILLAPPFAAHSVLLPDDPWQPHPTLQVEGDAGTLLARLNAACQARNLQWMLDVPLDRAAPGGAVARALPGAFLTRSDELLDPRAGPPVAAARWDTAGHELAAFWADRLRVWAAGGAAGFRLLGLAAVLPEQATDLIERAALQDATCVGWLDEVPTRLLEQWRNVPFGMVSLLTRGWDYRSDWLWERAEALAPIAPLLIAVEEPFGERLASSVSRPAALAGAVRRAAGFAASFGDGWLMTTGFTSRDKAPLDPRRGQAAAAAPQPRLEKAVQAANALPACTGRARHLSAPGDLIALAREGCAGAILINPDCTLAVRVDLPEFAGESFTLAPGEARWLSREVQPPILGQRPPRERTATEAGSEPRAAIEAISPAIDNGRFAVKRTVGDAIVVTADVVCDGHDQLSCLLQWRPADTHNWQEQRMLPLGNDRWQARFTVTRVGRWDYRIAAWRDEFATYRDGLAKKVAAGVNVTLELQEGFGMVAAAAKRLAALRDTATTLEGADPSARVGILLSAETATLMQQADERPLAVFSPEIPVDADRQAASFASWYEIFPRSMSDDPSRHGTFIDVIRHLPRIRDMGFDVLYFPPIHPIGRKNRKGRNNSLTPAEGDPGSPYAIGSAEGGHDALHPQLGTIEDFQRLREAAAEHGLEIAMDFAIQCSPDHPWLRDHKGWFDWRPDGSLRYAENPPKKYEDIVNVDFYTRDSVPDLWLALCDVVSYWAAEGVRIFRVDNPHTKPFPFWEWLIGEVRASYPDALFLAEAFTRPKVMNRLAKLGFTQSYTYFTWRNSKAELTEYLTQLNAEPVRDFFRPNFFVNTPDINPPYLQTSGRAGFLIRATLAATLSGLWGVYSGFELCEATPVPGREEYLDSEKYQIRAWDWDRPGNIVSYIAQLNRIRRRHPALQSHLGVTFLPSDNDQVLFYEKTTPDRGDVVLIAVSLDPHNTQSSAVELPLWRWSRSDHASLACEDLLHNASFTLSGKWQRVTLTPDAPATIWRARPVS